MNPIATLVVYNSGIFAIILAMRKHDVGFLIGIDAVKRTPTSKYDRKLPFKEQVNCQFI